MNPPLRTAEDAAALRAGIADGTIDCVVTDHAPHALHEKECEFEIAPFGVVGLETSLPLMLTNLVAAGKMTWQRLVEVMCVNPRKVARLAPGQGRGRARSPTSRSSTLSSSLRLRPSFSAASSTTPRSWAPSSPVAPRTRSLPAGTS